MDRFHGEEELPEGLTPAARIEYARFLSRLYEHISQVQEISLTILIWGSNPSSRTAAGAKRLEICAELRRRGHNAVVPEELPRAALGAGYSEKLREFCQVEAADMVVALLEDSPGALGEVHDFAEYPVLASKLFVLVPRRYKRGYAGRGVLRELESINGVYWYDEPEITSCHVMAAVIMATEMRREKAYRRRRLLESS